MQDDLQALLNYVNYLKENNLLINAQVLSDPGISISNNGHTFKPSDLGQRKTSLVSCYQIQARDFQTAISVIKKDPRVQKNYVLEIRPIIS